MDYSAIQQFLISESGRLSGDIARRTLVTSPWNALIKRGVWEDGLGNAPSTLVYESVLPSSSPTWQSFTYNIGSEASNCVPTAVTIGEAQTLRQYNLVHTALESSTICVENLRAPTMVKDQLGAVYANLAQNTAYAWKNKFREDYYTLAQHKISIGSSDYVDSSSTYSPDSVGGKLTNSLLEHFYLKLCRDGGSEDSMGRVDGMPIFPLIIGAETSRALLREEGYRTDIRESNMVPDLLKPLGARVSMLGYAHVVDLLPRRFDKVNGALVERPAYATDGGATYGTRSVISSAYESALYEEATIFVPSVMTSLVPKPITAPGGNTSFNPVDYSGTFKWVSYLSDSNPDGTLGKFRGILSHAAKPGSVWLGYTILHKRCSAPSYATC